MVEIVEVKTKKQRKLFATFPVNLYKDSPCYVPSFVGDEMYLDDPKKNLSKGSSEFRAFLAYKDHKLVGRIAGIINHESNKRHNEKCIRFSRIDFIDDKEVSKALIETIVNWGKEKGLEVIHGPWGFDDTDREGMLSFGYDEFSTYATAYSYPYYINHLEDLGFVKESEWHEFMFFLKDVDPRYYKAGEMVKRQNKYRDVCVNMPMKKIIKKYGDSFFECYNRAYAELDNFIPLVNEAKKATLKQFATIINPKFTSIIVDNKSDKVVAFVIVLPYIGDVLRKAKGSMIKAALPLLHTIKHPKKLELTLVGVDPDYRNSGAFALMFNTFYQNCEKAHITDLVADPILTTNISMMNVWSHMNKEVRCKRQTFRKNI
jgi:N-acetylglutamate synthase-like GNAT family acetyltransferase